jgi:hypothetical protein
LLGFRVVADHQQSCAGAMLQDKLRRRASSSSFVVLRYRPHMTIFPLAGTFHFVGISFL